MTDQADESSHSCSTDQIDWDWLTISDFFYGFNVHVSHERLLRYLWMLFVVLFFSVASPPRNKRPDNFWLCRQWNCLFLCRFAPSYCSAWCKCFFRSCAKLARRSEQYMHQSYWYLADTCSVSHASLFRWDCDKSRVYMYRAVQGCNIFHKDDGNFLAKNMWQQRCYSQFWFFDTYSFFVIPLSFKLIEWQFQFLMFWQSHFKYNTSNYASLKLDDHVNVNSQRLMSSCIFFPKLGQ